MNVALAAPALRLCRRPFANGKYAHIVLFFTVIAICGSFVGHSCSVAPYNACVMKDLDLTRTDLSTLWTITMFCAALWVNIIGSAVDRFGPQVFILLGGAAVALSLTLFGGARSAFEVTFSLMLLRLSSVETVDFACRHCVNHWFVENRGLAAGVLNAVSSIGFLLPAAETYSVVAHGWRSTARFFGLVCGPVIMISSVFLLSIHEDNGLRPYGLSNTSSRIAASRVPISSGEGSELALGHTGLTFRGALRAPVFWAILASWFVMCIPWAGINFHLMSILQDQSYDPKVAVFVYIALFGCSFLSAFLSGYLVDRIPAGNKQLSVAVVNIAMLFAVTAGAFLNSLPGVVGPTVLGLCLGVWEGVGNVVSTIIFQEIFGPTEVGMIRGFFIASTQFASGVGPLFTAMVMDFGVSFSSLCMLWACWQIAAVVLMLVVPPPSHRISPANLSTQLLTT